MITCPMCGYEKNFDGADMCERCESPLLDAERSQPSSPTERHILHDRIYALSPHKPIVVPPEMPVLDVLQTLTKHKVGCVLVMQRDELVGIFTERDALMRLDVDTADLSSHRVDEFMTPAPQTLDMTDKIAFALSKMDVGGYRHIPILTDGRVTGVISVRDILRYISDGLLATPA